MTVRFMKRNVNRRAGAGNAAGGQGSGRMEAGSSEPTGWRRQQELEAAYVNVMESRKKRTGNGWPSVYRSSEEMPPAFYQILLRLLAEELPGSALTVRVGKLGRKGDRDYVFLKVGEHGQRFRALMRCGLYPGLVTEPGFAAAVFCCGAAERGFWEKAGPFVQGAHD